MNGVDNEDIKMFILEQRKAGLTYEEIANRIYEKFGKHITRQAVYVQYSKYSYMVMEEEAINDIIEVFIRVADINETIIVLNRLSSAGLSSTKWSRRGAIESNFIKKNMKQIMERSNELKNKLGKVIDEQDGDGISMERIGKLLAYKGIVPKDSVISSYIDDVVAERCERILKREVCRIYDKLYTNPKENSNKKKSCIQTVINDLNEKGICSICDEVG